MSLQTTTHHDPYAALRNRDFRLLLVGRFITSFGNEMLTFAIAWKLWLRTHDAFALGLGWRSCWHTCRSWRTLAGYCCWP